MGALSLLRSLYRRLGPRYPRALLVVELAGAHVVVALGVAAILLYQEMSTAQLLVLLAVSQVLIGLENVLAYRLGVRLLRPADAWLNGERGPGRAAAAWRA